MSDVDDMGELLVKALHDIQKQKRLGWIRGVVVLIAAFAGAGWMAQSYLSQLATKNDISGLERQYSASFETLRSHDERQDERLSAIEPKCNEASQCCNRAQDRLDRLTTPRN